MQPKVRGYKKLILPKYTETKEEIKQVIDLNKVLRTDLSGEPGLVIEMGQFLIDQIVERTLNGRDVRGAPFKFNKFRGDKKNPANGSYSKAYTDSLEFQAFGKSPSLVNMQLTGLMLSSIDLADVSGGSVTILGQPDQVLKMFNHQTGDTVPHRPFFGVTNNEINSLKSRFRDDLRTVGANTEATNTLNQALFGSDLFESAVAATISEVLGF